MEGPVSPCPPPFSVVRKTAFSISMADLLQLLSEGGKHAFGTSSGLYRSRDGGQSTTIGQLGGLQHSAPDGPKPTTSPASSSDCLLLCFKAILPHLLDPQQQLER